jgi:DNA-binding NtrC family response regulator
MLSMQRVLIIDDYPDHLKIYGWILEQAGFDAVLCLARRTGVELPQDDGIRLVILDYALHCNLTPVQVAEAIRAAYPGAPIVLLSDVGGLPQDIAPYVDEFVRKGEPQKLIALVTRLLAVPQLRPSPATGTPIARACAEPVRG